MMSLWLSALASIPAAASDVPVQDVALATEVVGTVTWRGAAEGAESRPLQAFAKVREGDVVQLPADTRVELLYFIDGHSEVFAGPMQLVVGESSEPVSRTAGDARVGRVLEDLPGLVKRAELDKGGHTLVRGTAPTEVPLDESEQKEIEAARVHYAALRADSRSEEVLPEVYLSTVYLALGQTADAIPVLEEAHSRCGSCAGPIRLLAALRGE